MEIALVAVAIIAGIVGVILLIRFIIFLFCNPFTSKVLSLGCTIAAIVLAYQITNFDRELLSFENHIVPYFVLTLLGALFAVGEYVFDESWDGSFSFSDGVLTPITSGGFLWWTVGFSMVIFVGMLIADEYPSVFFVMPGLVLLANVISIFIDIKDNF